MGLLLIVVMVGLAALFFTILALLVLRAKNAPSEPGAASGLPVYSVNPAHTDYYRPAHDTNTQQTPKEKPVKSVDPRTTPLPKCPGCGTAVGFGEKRCSKCGRDLGPA